MVLMLVVLAAKFRGLQEFQILDQAQLARHLARGDGFVTSVLRPLSLGFQASVPHPDLYNAPGFPLVWAGVFKLFGPGDRAIAGTGAVLWVLSVWTVFSVGRRWYGRGPAAVATFFYAINVGGIVAAVWGYPYALLGILVLLIARLLFPDRVLPAIGPPPRKRDETPSDTPPELGPLLLSNDATDGIPPPAPWRTVLAGILSGVVVLTHYALLPLSLVLGFAVGHSQPVAFRKQCLLRYFGAMALVLLPWWIRSFRVAGSPFFTLYWYETLANSQGFRGESLWRHLVVDHNPVAYALRHPLQMGIKLLTGLDLYRQALPGLLDPWVLLLFAVALLQRVGPGGWRRLLGLVVATMLGVLFTTAWMRPEPGLWLVLLPVIALHGAAALVSGLPALVENWRTRRGKPALEWRLAGAYLTVLAVAGAPLSYYVLVARPPATMPPSRLPDIEARIPGGGLVVTDQPAMVAWRADRPALWLPQQEEDLTTIETSVAPLAGAYLTGASTRIPQAERGAWWFWLASGQGRFHGLVPGRGAPDALLWTRPQRALR
jgi:hypothetical protein